jgi:predicted TIM-barrel fold metal-dependent hydrolase
MHCGSGPAPGRYTGPGPVTTLLARHPGLRLIVAHMGMPEYSEFLTLLERYPEVRLDTTMAFTPFVEETMPFPRAEHGRLRAHGDRILFGSDFPNIPYRFVDAMRVLTRLPGVDDDWLRTVFHDNAARLFQLDT